MFRRRFTSILVLWGLAACAGAATPEEQRVKTFAKGIDYEYKTCQMTSLMMRALAESAAGAEAPVWRAYDKLYTFNRSLYDPQAAAFGLSPAPAAFTRFRGWVSAVAGRVFPGITMRATERLANKYVHKLRAMRDAAPPEHQEFAAYIVRMEELQIAFLAAAAKGDYAAAGPMVDRFLAENAQVREQILAGRAVTK